MSSATSPWDRGFESHFLAKSEICGIFLYISKIVFLAHTAQNVVQSIFVKNYTHSCRGKK
jgi:hypothetical protein